MKLKQIVFTSLFIFALTATGFAQNSKTEQAILALEKQWVEALLKADAAMIDKLYSEQLSYTHSTAVTDTKAEYMTNFKAGKTKYEAMDREEVKVRVFGNTALHTSKSRVRFVSNGQTQSFYIKMLHVWIKEGSTWRLVAHQTTRLPETK